MNQANDTLKPEEAATALHFAMQLTPRASAQLEDLPESLRQVVRQRLNQLTVRFTPSGAPTVRGHLLGTRFHAVYEVDNTTAVVRVLDIVQRD